MTGFQIFELVLQLFIWTVLITMVIEAATGIYWNIKNRKINIK